MSDEGFNFDSAFYEDARQEALTLTLGQVQCPSRYHWLLDIKGSSCALCGAAL